MDTFARLFALATDAEQAEWLNVAGRTFKRVCEPPYGDLQMSRLTDKLDDDGKWLVTSLADILERRR